MSRYGLPSALNLLAAKGFVDARDRARGMEELPDFSAIAQTKAEPSTNSNTFAMMKSAILAIEAALPVGSIDNSDTGMFSSSNARMWRSLVVSAEGPAQLMQCVIFLEDLIGEEWVKEDVGYLRSCLPARWKAIGEASPSSLAVRVILLDRSIRYGTVDRKRFNKKRSGRPKSS